MQHALPPSAEGSSGKVKRRSGPRSRSSPYKGVTQYKRTGRWEAHIWVSNPRGRGYQRHLGSYLTAEDAARAFDRATIRLRGMDDELNFAKEDYIHDAFMLEHGKVERLRFLDILRAHFAIPSEAARPPRPIKRPLTPPSSEDMSEGDEDVPTHRQASQSALHLRGAPPGGRMLRSAMHAGYAVRAVVHEDPVLVSSPKVGPGPHADEFVAFSGTVMVPVRPLEQHHARSSAAQAAEPSSAREFFCLPTPPPFPVEDEIPLFSLDDMHAVPKADLMADDLASWLVTGDSAGKSQDPNDWTLI